MLLVDTSAWIEAAKGTERSAAIKKEMSENRCYVTSESMAEVAKWCYENNVDVETIFEEIEKIIHSVLYMDRKMEKRAGEMRARAGKSRKNIGLVDCMIAAVAEENGLTMLTLDRHFLDLGVKTKLIR